MYFNDSVSVGLCFGFPRFSDMNEVVRDTQHLKSLKGAWSPFLCISLFETKTTH